MDEEPGPSWLMAVGLTFVVAAIFAGVVVNGAP
jgi:hypothetical protein